MARDHHRLVRRLDEARRAPYSEHDRLLRSVAEAIEEAETRVARRRAAVPAISYPPDLPITARRDDLLAALRDHQVVIVAGETGSGKSTQLPKLCLELGRGVVGMIGHTQPRRVAARAVAERVAEEVGTTVGGAVGYAVRFTDRVGEDTLVKVMTDGILLAEIQRDRRLDAYDTIIIDEAHERSLNVDFLLGYLKQLLPRRPDLKLVITSATIDTERFSAHFDGAPVVQVSGRSHPVEIRYRPFGAEPDDDRDQIQAITDAVEELADEGPGDVLVFLSGEREIHDTADALRRMELRDTEILPLYARLSSNEQHRIFQSHRGRRIVLATNVAETSLTVPGIRYVIDAGTARISRYSRRLKVQRLPIEPVSQASAAQRSGRCGRIGPGIAIRLYSQADFDARPAYTEPEILRTNLASVILQMSAIGLGDIAAFPFVEPPDARSIKDGVALLEELGAFDPDEEDPRRRLTRLGRTLAQLPIDPRLARMVVEADRLGCLREVVIIAAALSIQDPRERPTGFETQAGQMHARFVAGKDEPGSDSDFLTLLRLWDHLRERQRELSSTQFRKLCRNEYLNYLRVREWQDLTSQIRQVSAQHAMRVHVEDGHPDDIHRALLTGLLSHIGLRDGEGTEFRGARNARFAIGRGSSLTKRPPKWVMAAELVETNRLWARTVARIQPQWVEKAGEHLVKRTYSDPHWDPQRGIVAATERVTLYGLPIVTGRLVDVGRIDPDVARLLFIRHALVEGDWDAHHAFLAANRDALAAVRSLEQRTRRDLLLSDDEREAWFAERLGAEVTSAARFDRWWKRQRQRDPDVLTLTPSDLLDPSARGIDPSAYPDVWVDGAAGGGEGPASLRLTYVFDLSSRADGVSVHVPLTVLDRVAPEPFEWHVPGRREELVTLLVRALPKPVRRHLIPAADHALAFLAAHPGGPADGSLRELLARFAAQRSGLPLRPSEVALDQLPDDLRITFVVEDSDGRPIAASKDLRALQARMRPQIRLAIAAAAGVEQGGLRTWTLGDLPRVVDVRRDGHVVPAYPALVDEGETVGVRVFTNPDDQARSMVIGTRRLLALTVPSPRRAIQRELSGTTKLALARTRHASVGDLLDDCVRAALDHLLTRHGGPAWTAEGFERLRLAVAAELERTAVAVASGAGRILSVATAIEIRLDTLVAPSLQPAVADMRAQIERLVHPGFVSTTGVKRLSDVLRYVRGIEQRLDRLAKDPPRDAQKMAVIHRVEDRFAHVLTRLPPGARAAEEVQAITWLLEELRVSVFAQSLGTARPVSEQRVTHEIDRLLGLF